MNRYQTPIPRKAFALAALALTAMTVGLSVIVPVKIQSDPRALRTLTAITVTPPAAQVPPERLRVDVTGIREPDLAVQVRTALPPKRKQDS